MQSYSLVINAPTAEELKQKIAEVHASICNGGTVTSLEGLKSADKPAPKGRKPKEKDTNPFAEEAAPQAPVVQTAPQVAEVASDNPFDDEAPAAPAKAPLTAADVKAAIQKVADKKGMEGAKAIVAALKVTKVSEIKESQYDEAVALCEKALK